MATTNLNAISVQHSKNIGDPVATADLGGKRWSSAQRTYHINEAIRRWLIKQIDIGRRKESRSQEAAKHWESLGTYIISLADNVVDSSKSLENWGGSDDIAWVLSAYNDTDNIPVKELPQRLYPYTQTGGNSFLTASATNQYYTLNTGLFQLQGGTNPSSIQLVFVKKHVDLVVDVAGGTLDIQVPSHHWAQIQDLAFKVAMEEVGDSESAAKGLLKEQMVNGEIA
jgi:hypothetical protein